MLLPNTFKKSERLSNDILIKELFSKGNSFFSYPYKFFYLSKADLYNHSQVVISVSKRSFKKSVDRNLIKRRIREAYRLNKNLLNNLENHSGRIFAIVYIAKEILSSNQIEQKLKPMLARLADIN